MVVHTNAIETLYPNKTSEIYHMTLVRVSSSAKYPKYLATSSLISKLQELKLYTVFISMFQRYWYAKHNFCGSSINFEVYQNKKILSSWTQNRHIIYGFLNTWLTAVTRNLTFRGLNWYFKPWKIVIRIIILLKEKKWESVQGNYTTDVNIEIIV